MQQMGKRSRKRALASSRKKRIKQPKQSNENGDTNTSQSEPWALMEFMSIDDLQNDDAAGCDADGCQLKALCVHQGEVSKDEWKPCLDCQLKDHEVWPTIDECKDAPDKPPFTREMTVIVKSKCTNERNASLPSYLFSNDSNEELQNDNAVNESDHNIVDDAAITNIPQVPPVVTANDAATAPELPTHNAIDASNSEPNANETTQEKDIIDDNANSINASTNQNGNELNDIDHDSSEHHCNMLFNT